MSKSAFLGRHCLTYNARDWRIRELVQKTLMSGHRDLWRNFDSLRLSSLRLFASGDALVPSFLFLVVRPETTSSFLLLVTMPFVPFVVSYYKLS